MLRLSCTALALALGLTSSCRREPTKPPPQGQETPRGKPTLQSLEPGPRVKHSTARRAGVAHSGAIDKVVLSPDGRGALTRDAIGGVRLWTALDGSREPLAMPIRAPQALSLSQRGDGWLAFAVDATGGAKIIAIDAQDRITTKAELPPFDPLIEGHVLAGGERILALFRDHSLRLFDAAGKELARLEERKFRPNALRVTPDGKRVLAVLDERSGSTTKLELQPIELVLEGKASIRRAGTPRLFTSQVEIGSSTLGLSPDGSRVALVDKWNGTQWDLVVLDLRHDTPEQRFSVMAQAHTVPGVGFVSPTSLLASANDGSVSWLVDTERKSVHVRTAPPQDFNGQLRVQAFGPQRHVAGHGNWLYVADTKDGHHHFLGYRSLQATSIAISPNGNSVATVYPQGPVWIEPLAGKGTDVAALPTDPFNGVFKVRFMDDDRLLLVDGLGGVQMVDWHTGEVVAETGVNGSIRSVQVAPERGLLLIDRHSTVNDTRLFEFDAKVDHGKPGFRGPYIIADTSYRTGLLTRGAPGHTDAVMWTLDSSNRMRFYTMKELRSDLSADEVKGKAIDLKPGQIAPLAIDRLGRHYGVRWNGSRMEVFVDNGEHVRSKAIGDGSVNEIWPSADGTRFLAVNQRSGSMAITVYESESLKELWSMSSGTFHNEVVWSPGGDYVGVAAPTGAVVQDGKTGESAYQRCGLDFEVLGTAPSSAFSLVNQRTICEP
ncbi:MAG: hypothetical protein K1X88_00620 [Nannocystaceae bacterium]|nr:hypothetical protein [Nannocystaceae bacterium]